MKGFKRLGVHGANHCINSAKKLVANCFKKYYFFEIIINYIKFLNNVYKTTQFGEFESIGGIDNVDVGVEPVALCEWVWLRVWPVTLKGNVQRGKSHEGHFKCSLHFGGSLIKYHS